MFRHLQVSIDPDPGVRKHVVGYPTLPRPGLDPKAQATESLLGRGTLELVRISPNSRDTSIVNIRYMTDAHLSSNGYSFA